MVLDFKPSLNRVENCTSQSIYPETLHCSWLLQVGLGFLSGFCFDSVWLGFFFMCSICLFFKLFFIVSVCQNECLTATRKKNSAFLELNSLHLPGCGGLWRFQRVPSMLFQSQLLLQCVRNGTKWLYFAVLCLHAGNHRALDLLLSQTCSKSSPLNPAGSTAEPLLDTHVQLLSRSHRGPTDTSLQEMFALPARASASPGELLLLHPAPPSCSSQTLTPYPCTPASPGELLLIHPAPPSGSSIRLPTPPHTLPLHPGSLLPP